MLWRFGCAIRAITKIPDKVIGKLTFIIKKGRQTIGFKLKARDRQGIENRDIILLKNDVGTVCTSNRELHVKKANRIVLNNWILFS